MNSKNNRRGKKMVTAIKNECKHKFRRIIGGPVLVVHKCRLCGQEIIDVIDHGPHRIAWESDGVLYFYDGYTDVKPD